MPQYQISVPGQGTFRVDSPTELTDLQAWQAVQSQLAAGPSKERTFGEAAKDIAAGVVSGAGSLVQLPGQLYGLATGDFSETGALGLGKDIAKYGEEMKSAGLKAREAARAEKIKAAEQTGQFEAFKTAFGETIKDPALLTSFLAEQAPQLLVPFGAAKVAQIGTAAKAAAAAQGLTGTAAKEAVEAVTKEAARRGTAAAIGAGGVQQGADVGAQAYEDIYKELKSKGATDADAAQGAINLARAAGASGALISLLAQRLPGARTLEESFAGVPGTSGRLLGAVKGAAGEGISEVVEETGGKFGANLAMREVKPEQSLLEGLGQTAGMAAIGGIGMGGVSGLARRPAPQPEVVPPVQAPPPVVPTATTVPKAPPVTTPTEAPPTTPVVETPPVATTATTETPPAETPPVTETPAVATTPTEGPDVQLDVAYGKKGPEGSFLSDKTFLASGSESDVFRAGNSVYKITEPYNDKSEETYQARIRAAQDVDQILGDGTLKVSGFYLSPNGTKNPVFQQEFIEGRPATREEIRKHMESRGFAIEEKGSLTDTFSKIQDGQKIVAKDLDGDNVKVDSGNKVRVIDGSIIKTPIAKTSSTPTETTPPVEQPKTLEEFRERMPTVFDNAEVRAANEEGNFAKLAKALQRSTNPAIRRIGQLGSGVASKITLKKPAKLGGRTAGRYTYADDAIQMIPSYAGDEHTNAHETLHALIARAQLTPTERQRPIVQQIDKLYEHVKRELKKKGITVQQAYGLKNAREFTAEAMTNPEFQFELMQIPYPGRKTAWTQFVKLVADLLGIQNTNALTEVMNLVDRLAVQKQPRRKISEKGLSEEMEDRPPELDTSGLTKVIKGRDPQVQAAAQLLKEGKLTREEYEQYVNYYTPIEAVEADKLLLPSTEEAMRGAVASNKANLVNQPIADGAKVGLRLDIPATRAGVPTVSVHEGASGKASQGKAKSYTSTAHITNATFESRSQKAGLDIAVGAGKEPLQTVEGTWVNEDPQSVFEKVKGFLRSPDWVQVGFDPTRHGYFYDRKTGDPVASASEVYQIGTLLVAKDVKYAPKTDFLYSLGKEQTKQLQDFQQTLRNLLNKFGLKDVGLNIEEGMDDAGSYSQQLIRIASDEANPIRTLRHEAIHALRELGFFTDAQWNSLSKMAKDKWIDQYLKQRNEQGRPLKAGEESRYDAYMREYNGDMEKITEEAVADAFADFDATKPPAGMLQALLKRMKDLFQSIKSALTKIESPEQIFGKVEKGELKPGEKRQAGERKSVRDRATANFLRWFGDSKVVDEKGEPLVVYHGTNKTDSLADEPDQAIGQFDSYVNWFTTDPYQASGYATQDGRKVEGAATYPAYLSLQKPLRLRGDLNDKTTYAEFRKETGLNVQPGPYEDEVIDGVEQSIPRWWITNSPNFADTAEAAGYDGVIADEGGTRTFGVFYQNPGKIKSATGNNGDYSLTNADIRKSLGKVTAAAQKALQKQPMPEKGLSHVSKDLTNLAQPIFFPQNKTVLDRIDSMKDRFWQRLAQKTADQFRTIKEYSPLGYMQARLSKSVDGSLEGLLFHGQVFDDGGALNIKKNTKGMMDILKPIGNELDSYLMWVALNRESRLPEDKRLKMPGMKTLVERRAEFAAGELNGKPRVEVYQDVLRQMNQLNKSVLDIALAKGLIDQAGYDKFSNDIYYIPFYKKMEEDGTIEGAQTASGLTSQYFSKELKGGEAPFGDLMENIVRNWSHILSASMKNAAAQTTINDAMQLQAAEPNLKTGLEWKDGKVYSTSSGKPIEAKLDEDGKQIYAEGELRPDLTTNAAGMAKIMVNGQPMYFKVTDDLLMDSISSIGYMGPKSKFLDVARNFKNMLQYGVTASPIFKVNNLIRDSVSALAVSDLKKSPVYNVMTGISLSKKDSPTYISALAGGGIFNFGSAYEGDQAKLIKRLIDQGVDGDTILDSKEKITKALKKTWDAYQHLGDRSEAANRLALYQQMRDKGMSHLQASFMARDLLDFSMQGSWPAFRLITQVVPFMNARIQGLYKLGRDGINPTVRVLYNATTGKEIDANDKVRAAQFSVVTAAVMAASALLYMSFKDDEDFKKRDAWDRDNFWWFKIPSLDIAFRVPKPFEVGAFGTLVERSLEQIYDQGAEGKTFADSLKRTLWDTFALNPTPQMFKPLFDLYANKDSFSGAPIESAGLERLSKQERMTEQTSPLAIALSKVWSTVMPAKVESSPIQVDYAIKGYFGWLGAMASMASTYAVMPFKEGEYPDARWLDRASLGLVRDLPAPQSAYVTAFYENAKEISQAYADMRHYREIGDAEKVQELLEEKGDKIALAKFYDKTSKNIANVRKQIQFITNDKTLDGATKKEEIERMKLIMSDLAKQAEEVRKSMKP